MGMSDPIISPRQKEHEPHHDAGPMPSPARPTRKRPPLLLNAAKPGWINARKRRRLVQTVLVDDVRIPLRGRLPRGESVGMMEDGLRVGSGSGNGEGGARSVGRQLSVVDFFRPRVDGVGAFAPEGDETEDKTLVRVDARPSGSSSGGFDGVRKGSAANLEDNPLRQSRPSPPTPSEVQYVSETQCDSESEPEHDVRPPKRIQTSNGDVPLAETAMDDTDNRSVSSDETEIVPSSTADPVPPLGSTPITHRRTYSEGPELISPTLESQPNPLPAKSAQNPTNTRTAKWVEDTFRYSSSAPYADIIMPSLPSPPSLENIPPSLLAKMSLDFPI